MNKLTFLFFSALVFPLTMMAQAWDDAKYKAIEASIVAPQFADAEFDITATGITTASTPKEIQTAINSTIDKCSEAGGGKVIIPPGTWNTGAITLKSNVNLVVKAGATLLFAYDPFLYPLVKTRWEGLDIMNYSPCIYAYQAKNVAITGDGIIDGNGTKDTWWKWCGAAKYGYDANTLQSQSNEYAGKNAQYKQVDENFYWSGDARPGMKYNEMVDIRQLPGLDKDGSEHLVDYNPHYIYCLNIGYNEAGTPGKGSAIFLHCLGSNKPYTGGCVAIPEDKMRFVLQHVRPECKVVIDSLTNLGGSL